MLAEIFMLRMEAVSRASKETAPADNSRFVPITLADSNSALPAEDECSDECSKPRGAATPSVLNVPPDSVIGVVKMALPSWLRLA